VDIVLGVSMAPDTVRLVVIEGQDADGVTVEQDEFAVAATGDSATSGAVDQVIAAIIGTREGAGASGYQVVSTGVTWTDPAGAGALRDAVAAHDAGTVMLVAPLLAAAALAQTVGASIGYERIAMLFVEPRSATLAVVDVADGSIVDLHRHQLAHAGDGALAAELAAMVADLDGRRSRADGVFLIGCGTDIVPLKPALEAATPLEVTASEEPDMALARGAALASANAPLFASTTAAMAYALDPGTGEVNPRALPPTYLDVSANAQLGSDALAYSAVDDDGGDRPRRGRSPFLLAGSALAAVSAVVAGALVVSLASDRPTSAVRPSPPASGAPSQPPQAQAPAPTAPPPPAPTAQVAAPPPPAPAEQPAPAPTAVAAPPAPVHRAPPRRAPEYVPTPVQQVAPAPQPEAPPPAPPPAAPAPPPAAPAAPPAPQQPPMTMYLHFPFVTVPIPITPPAPPPAP
jgi:hypothetical protein